jgi:hypothetical protein
MSFQDVALLLGVLAVWIVLFRWVLPWFGIGTCMSGQCRLVPPPTRKAQPSEEPQTEEKQS